MKDLVQESRILFISHCFFTPKITADKKQHAKTRQNSGFSRRKLDRRVASHWPQEILSSWCLFQGPEEKADVSPWRIGFPWVLQRLTWRNSNFLKICHMHIGNTGRVQYMFLALFSILPKVRRTILSDVCFVDFGEQFAVLGEAFLRSGACYLPFHPFLFRFHVTSSLEWLIIMWEWTFLICKHGELEFIMIHPLHSLPGRIVWLEILKWSCHHVVGYVMICQQGITWISTIHCC